MQKLACLTFCLAISLSATSWAAECQTATPDRSAAAVRERMASAVKITIRTPSGQPAHGTGIIWDSRGHIITNDHVVAAGDAHSVTLMSGETRPARVMARAPDRDLAVLAVDGPLPAPAPRAASGALRTGDPVLAVGNPFGRGLSLAHGVVKGFGREVITGPTTHLKGMMETTAPLAPGNSGGPLFDCNGHVVGINTAAVQNGYGGHLGFAIPMDRVQEVAAALLPAPTTVADADPRPAAPPSPDSAVSRPGLGLYVVPDGTGSLVVQRVVSGSPAERAGARPGDAIMEANGHTVSSPADLQRLVRQAGTGTITVLRVVRSGSAFDMAVRIAPLVFSS